jgi:hypothetical protein
MRIHPLGPRHVSTAAVLALLMTAGVLFLAQQVHASSDHYIVGSTSNSCVYTVNPCTNSILVTLSVTEGDTIVLWTSDYPRCSVSSGGTPSDSANDAYANTGNNSFQFAACSPPGAYAIDYQSAYYSTAKVSGTITVSISYTTAPYEADMIVDDVSGAGSISYEVALCNGSEASPCMPSGPGSFGVPQLSPSANSLVIAYGSASSDSTILENPLSPGPGYVTDQGPVYPGGYMLDSLTEYSTPNAPSTAPFDTSTPTDGWGEIVIVLSPTSTATSTQTLTLTETEVLTSVVTSYSVVIQTATVPITLASATTITETAIITSTSPDLIPGVGNDTLILSLALIVAALLIAAALLRVAARRT